VAGVGWVTEDCKGTSCCRSKRGDGLWQTKRQAVKMSSCHLSVAYSSTFFDYHKAYSPHLWGW
jgi:hypothetical protein